MTEFTDQGNRSPEPITPALDSGKAREQEVPVLEARGLWKSYRRGEVEVPALNGVTLAVYESEFVAVMGPSGSGKSTLLYLLGGLDRPSEGNVRVGGQAFTEQSDDELALFRRRRIGFIFQFYNLIPTLTAVENVALPLIIDGANRVEHRRRIDTLLHTVGLWPRRNHKPDQLSGGEQQRVAIARALVNEPKLVLADEPTGNLDSRTGANILALLRSCSEELGQTIVMVTHDAEAAAYADRVVFLRDGGVVERMQLAGGSGAAEILERFGALEKGGGAS